MSVCMAGQGADWWGQDSQAWLASRGPDGHGADLQARTWRVRDLKGTEGLRRFGMARFGRAGMGWDSQALLQEHNMEHKMLVTGLIGQLARIDNALGAVAANELKKLHKIITKMPIYKDTGEPFVNGRDVCYVVGEDEEPVMVKYLSYGPQGWESEYCDTEFYSTKSAAAKASKLEFINWFEKEGRFYYQYGEFKNESPEELRKLPKWKRQLICNAVKSAQNKH